jgi:hypothetical protein
MPLAFDSLSHGKIAFGFFNIETDLLLLNRYFFFASDFCRRIMEAAEGLRERKWEADWEVYSLEEAAIGSLMGAIHGVDLRGFIGEVYRLFPFPEGPEGFKQNPEGFRTRSSMEQIVIKHGPAVEIPVRFQTEKNEVGIGEYRFNQDNFQELILYVWLGGYPRWRDGRQPGYVETMKQSVEKAGCFPFKGIKERWKEKNKLWPVEK